MAEPEAADPGKLVSLTLRGREWSHLFRSYLFALRDATGSVAGNEPRRALEFDIADLAHTLYRTAHEGAPDTLELFERMEVEHIWRVVWPQVFRQMGYSTDSEYFDALKDANVPIGSAECSIRVVDRLDRE